MSSVPQLSPSQLSVSDTAKWKEILRQALIDLRAGIPAIVQSFDPDSQCVAVQIAIREVVRTDDGPQNIAIGAIYNVPVAFPSAGGFSLTFPIEEGDEGWLVFGDACIDLWKARGGVQNQLERRRHDLNDCVFIPAGRSQPRALSNYSTASAQLRSDDGTVVIDIAEDGITLTAPKVSINSTGDVDINASGNVNINGEQIVAASSGDDTKIDGKVFLQHEHSAVQPGGGTSGPVA